MIQVNRQIRMYKEELWNIIVIKTPYREKLNKNDGFYEFWLNNDEYGHMMHITGMGLKNWKEAKEYLPTLFDKGTIREYSYEIQKLEADDLTPTTSYCPVIDTIIPLIMKGVNNSNEKKNEETQGQKSLHTDSK